MMMDREMDRMTNAIDMGHFQPLLDAGFNNWSVSKQKKELRKALKNQRTEYLDELDSYAKKGDWEKVCTDIKMHPFIMEEGFDKYYEQIPDEMKLDFVTELYFHNGDHCDNICTALTEIDKYQKPDLPDWMKKQDEITVYRGCADEDELFAFVSLSWTTEKDVAEFFANRNAFFTGGEGIVYRAKIHPDDILNYRDDGEKEVLQFKKVYDIEQIPFIPDRVKSMEQVTYTKRA